MRNTIKRSYFITAIICVVLLAVILLLIANKDSEPKPYSRISSIEKDECKLCNDSNFSSYLFPPGNNVAIVFLNTFRVDTIDINPHPIPANDKKLLENYNGSCVFHFSRSESGSLLCVSVIQDQSKAYFSVSDDAALDIEALATHLCTDCLTLTLDRLKNEGDNSEIALLNLENREIYIIEENMRVWSGDYFFLSSIYNRDRYVDIFYLPKRENYVPVWNDTYTDYAYQ